MANSKSKYLILSFLVGVFFFISSTLFGQCSNVCGTNLIPNGNFEGTTTNCSDTIGELFYNYSSVSNWFGVEEWPCYPAPQNNCGSGSTPDYHNVYCADSSTFEGCGSGDGSVGLFTSVNVGGGGWGTISQNREYVQVKLSSPLIAGKEYCASMLVKSTYQSQVMVSADGIGMWFTDQKVNIGTQNGGQQFIGSGSIVNATPQVQNLPGNIIDSNCTVVSGTFCASGGEEWLVIGNFLPDSLMTANGPGFFGTKINYMLIDDVNLKAICPPDPQLNISNTSIVCGTTINTEVVNVPLGSTIEWISPSNFIGNTTSGPFSDAPNSTTEYAVVVTTNNSCGTVFKDTLRSSVTVNCGPEISLNVPSDTLCQGSCTTVEAVVTGGLPPYTVTWNNGLLNGTGPYTICPSASTTYTASVTDGNGHVDDTSITVHVGIPDSTYIVHSICDGSTIDLYGNTISSNGIYTQSFTNIYGCDSVEYNEVVILPTSSSIQITSSDLSDCNAQDGKIMITGLLPDSTYTISYLHNGTVGPQSHTADAWGEITLNNLSSGEYTDFLIHIQGCTTTLNNQLFIDSPNSPSADAGDDLFVCENQEVTLSANSNPTEIVSWNNGVSNAVPFVPSIGVQTYTLTVTNASGCSATDDVNVTVFPLPIVDAGQDITVCEGDEVVLEVNGNANYLWDNGVINGSPFVPNTGTTIYTVTAVDGNGCVSLDSINVTVNKKPEISIIVSDSSGCAPLTVSFSNGYIGSGSQCIWDLGDGTMNINCGSITHTYNNPGCYDVTLTQVEGTTNCTNSILEENLICVGEKPTATFNYHPINPSEDQPEVHFTNTSTGANNYLWTFNDSVFSFEVNPSHSSPKASGVYTIQLIASSLMGCFDTARVKIYVDQALRYYVPNTFTPDGNGTNDIFLPIMTSGFNPYEYKLLVFNRWGEIVFESLNPYEGWDGTYQSKIMPDGVYIWKIEFMDNNTDERTIDQGHVNLLR